MVDTLVKAGSQTPINIYPINQSNSKDWLKNQDKQVTQWLKNVGFNAAPGSYAFIPNSKGKLEKIIYVTPDKPNLWDWAKLPPSLPLGLYKINSLKPSEAKLFALAWALETYSFNTYKKSEHPKPKQVTPAGFEFDTASSIYLVRDLINTPANDMGPDNLSTSAKKICKSLGAEFRVTIGENLIKEGYPSIFAVGNSHHRSPRLIDIRWGERKYPKLTIVGKGVCFDTGGLNIKSTPNMALMKKDMGGAAHALGLAQMLILAKTKVRLRVLIPAVENSVSSKAMRPGDVIKTRKGLTIEISNTDAEGRVILADALTEASRENPEIIINFATLTGAARVALGAEIPALFSNNDPLAETIVSAGKKVSDPVWRMPLWHGYKSEIQGKVADLTNSPTSPLAGAITAALFLEEFVEPQIAWAHIDLMAWNIHPKPGRPVGGEAMSVRAIYEALSQTFK